MIVKMASVVLVVLSALESALSFSLLTTSTKTAFTHHFSQFEQRARGFNLNTEKIGTFLKAVADEGEGEYEESANMFVPEEEIMSIEIPSDGSDWEIPNDFEMFLNQCTIQSFMFLLKTCRDPQTVMWVEEFTQPVIAAPNVGFSTMELPARVGMSGSGASKLLTYHGLHAMNTAIFPTWDVYFSSLLEKPCESHIIESAQAHIRDYELDINPPSLCSRMISVREQIAREFVSDLDVISRMGGYTLESYWESLKVKSETDENKDPDVEGAIQGRTGGIANLLFLEYDPFFGDTDVPPSPLRKGNFDLLILLTTQEAIHRVLNNDDDEDDDTPEERVSRLCNRQFLFNFYVNRIQSHFIGRQRYGRADDFLFELLSETPSVIQISEDVNGLVDPTRTAELVLIERANVALEWKAIAASIPDAHINIKRLQLNLLMKSYGPRSNDDQAVEQES